jgi:hypothetical protein
MSATTNDCIVLARARIRVIRAEIELNHIILAAREDNMQAIQEIIGWVERRVSRAAFADILNLIPELREHYPETIDTNELINNLDDTPRRQPLADITNLPMPPVLRRQ